MSATGMLRKDHEHVMRLERVITRCSEALYAGAAVPLEDVERLAAVISEFLDSVHYSREEDSYFPCAGASGGFAAEVRKFLVEHQFGRNVARQIGRHLRAWREGGGAEAAREPVARFLRAYAVYLRDHVRNEDRFFDEAEKAMDPEEEREMAEYFMAVMATTGRVEKALAEIDYLESRAWR